MTEKELFKIIKNYWPASIDISDMDIFNDGDCSWNLVECEEAVRRRIPPDGGLLEAAIWPYYVTIGEAARRNYLTGILHVSQCDVDFCTFCKYLKIQLSKDWEDAKKELKKSD